MFINESVNVNDSAVFYGFMREALIEQVKNDNEVVAMLESASDADIMSYAVLGKAVPSDVDAGLLETVLHGVLKDVVLENTDIFSDGYTASQFIHEIGPLSDISSKDVLTEWGHNDIPKAGELYDKFHKWTKQYSGNPSDEAIGKTTMDGSMYEKFKGGLERLKNQITSNADTAFQKVSSFVTQHSTEIGATAIVALVSFAAYKVYQSFLSKAARACAGKSGDAKKACMVQAKEKAKAARINALNKGIALGSKSSNPAKVKSALKASITKIKK